MKSDQAKIKGLLKEEQRLQAEKIESESEDEASLEQNLAVEDLGSLPLHKQTSAPKLSDDDNAEGAGDEKEEANEQPNLPAPGQEPQMLNPSLRAALSKQVTPSHFILEINPIFRAIGFLALIRV